MTRNTMTRPRSGRTGAHTTVRTNASASIAIRAVVIDPVSTPTKERRTISGIVSSTTTVHANRSAVRFAAGATASPGVAASVVIELPLLGDVRPGRPIVVR